MNSNKLFLYMLILLGGSLSLSAQSAQTNLSDGKPTQAWEFGLGGSVFQFNRTSFSNFQKVDEGYQFDLHQKRALFGLNLYVARELNNHFYLDIQGSLGFTTEKLHNKDQSNYLFMVGPGLQWRLGDYFGSKYIDPYLRAGINYMHKNFNINYAGTEGLDSDAMTWIMNNVKNKEGVDRKDLMPISLGGGLNMWLNDKWGIGTQADYLIMPYKGVANSLQGSIRVLYRLGGQSKKSPSTIQYVNVERVIEKPVIQEKVVEVPVEKEVEQLCDFFNNINFEFDKDVLTTESEIIVDHIAKVLKKNTNRRYLITGYTDSKGSPQYNLNLSKRRAETIVKALRERGVPQTMLQARGVGSKIAYATSSTSDTIRRGDRKVTIELITNMDYWNYLSDK